MSLNILLKNTAQQEIESLENLSPELVEKFLHKLEKFENSKLYISAVQRNLNISKQDALEVVEILVRLRILNIRYQIKVDDVFYPEEYEKLKDIPGSVYDDESDTDIKIDMGKNIFVFFRVN